MFSRWRPPNCPRERRRKVRERDRCKELEEEERRWQEEEEEERRRQEQEQDRRRSQAQEQDRRRSQAQEQERRRSQEQERQRWQAQEQKRRRSQAQEQERRRWQAQEQERRRAQVQDRSSTQMQDRSRSQLEDRSRSQPQERSRIQLPDRRWQKAAKAFGLIPPQSSEEEITRDNSGIIDTLKHDKLTIGFKITAAVILLLFLYSVLGCGNLHYCFCFEDIWCGIKDSVELILGEIKRKILDIISNDGLCISPYLKEVLFHMEMCILNMCDSMFATFRIVHFLVEKLIPMETART